jgi:hypothetical protein
MAITDTSIYQDKIMGGVEGDPNPFGYQNQINNFVIDNEEFEEIPGYNFIDAPTSLPSRLQNPQYLNNPFKGPIDSFILSKGNPDNSLINRTTNVFGNFKDTIGGGLKSILDNTIIGRIGAARDATNPRAGNYNPALQGQIDFLKSQGMYGTNPNTGLPQITSGVLAGKNLQSMFGSNDLMDMYDKSIARTQKTIDNFANQWGNLKEEDEDAYNAKLQVHINRLQAKKNEQAAAAAAAQAEADARSAIERDRARTAPQRREGRGGDHMSRSVGQGGLGISQAQAQAVSDANREAGMSGWGLADGGRVYLNLGGIARLL